MIEDSQLVAQYLNGDEKSLNELVLRYSKIIYNFVYRLIGSRTDASDITQETFVKIWKNLKRYDPKQSFKTWIMTIARNSAIDWLRKRKIAVFSDLDNPESDESFEDRLQDKEPLADEIFEKKEIKALIEAALQKISLDQRMAITLHAIEGLTFEEIAKDLRKSPNTIKSHYRRGLAAMKNSIIAPN